MTRRPQRDDDDMLVPAPWFLDAARGLRLDALRRTTNDDPTPPRDTDDDTPNTSTADGTQPGARR